MRLKETREQEQEKQWDELFNEMKPMVPQKQEWRRKKAEHSSLEAGGQTTEVPIGPPQKGKIHNLSGPSTVLLPLSRSDRQDADGPIARATEAGYRSGCTSPQRRTLLVLSSFKKLEQWNISSPMYYIKKES